MLSEEETAKINKSNDRKRHKVLNTLAPGWSAPDGGWGWVVVIANGFITLFSLALYTCFGLIFRDRFKELGINSSQTTTLLSINSATAAFVGLANGPLFRRFSYRQVGCVAGVTCGMSIIVISHMNTFYGFMFFFSFIYASAKSVGMSASSLALITYFEKKRRLAVGLTWACSSVGSIVNPQLTTILMPIYGASGTVLIFGGYAFNTVVCALLLQPVAKHATRNPGYESIKSAAKEHEEDMSSTVVNGCGKTSLMESIKQRDTFDNLLKKRSSQRFGSQYLYYDVEDNIPVEEEIGSETPMIPRANNDCFSKLNTSHASLTSKKIMEREGSRPTSIDLRRKSSLTALKSENSIEHLNRESSEVDDRNQKMENDSTRQIVVSKSCKYIDDVDCYKNNGPENLHNNDYNTGYLQVKSSTVTLQEVKEAEQNKLSWCTRAFHIVTVFFDLDLLQDCVYVNLIFGISLSFFTEINCVLLMPYILLEYGLRDAEAATIMSIISIVDLTTRITISFIATRIGWGNRIFFLLGIGISVLGRIGLAHQSTYGVLMAIAVLVGIGKSLIIVFSTLVIPDHVSQEKLPAATGLQLVTRGIVFLFLGPICGWIRDTTGNYTIVLHFLNIFSCLVIISWILEIGSSSWRRQRLERIKQARVQ